jgi:hypothetical protein
MSSSDNDYEIFLRAVKRKSEDQELADLILSLTTEGEDIANDNTDDDITETSPLSVQNRTPTLLNPTAVPVFESKDTNDTFISITPSNDYLISKLHSEDSIDFDIEPPYALTTTTSTKIYDPLGQEWIQDFLTTYKKVVITLCVYINIYNTSICLYQDKLRSYIYLGTSLDY